jgi:hypothetical protein
MLGSQEGGQILGQIAKRGLPERGKVEPAEPERGQVELKKRRLAQSQQMGTGRLYVSIGDRSKRDDRLMTARDRSVENGQILIR